MPFGPSLSLNPIADYSRQSSDSAVYLVIADIAGGLLATEPQATKEGRSFPVVPPGQAATLTNNQPFASARRGRGCRVEKG